MTFQRGASKRGSDVDRRCDLQVHMSVEELEEVHVVLDHVAVVCATLMPAETEGTDLLTVHVWNFYGPRG